ncbi:hypothetical protein D3C76_1750660 [compost metagenome]
MPAGGQAQGQVLGAQARRQLAGLLRRFGPGNRLGPRNESIEQSQERHLLALALQLRRHQRSQGRTQ